MIDERINTINTLSGLEDYRREMNEAIDKRADYIKLCVKADELSKGSFGRIKECFEHLSPELFKTDDGKDIMRKYMNTVKGNKQLSTVHGLYESVRKAGSDTDTSFLANAMTSKQWVTDKTRFNEGVSELGKILAEACLYLGKEAVDTIPETDMDLDNAVMYIAENKMSHKNMAEYGKAVAVIKESIGKSESTDLSLGDAYGNYGASVEDMVAKFNLMYEGTLTEDEAALIREVATCTDRKALFEKYQAECVKKVDESVSKYTENGDKDSANRLKNVSQKIKSKTYKEETLMEDVSNMLELGRMFLNE